MQKRIFSIILTLSIVTTLFAGLGVSASAADDGYVTQGGYSYKETDYSFNHANATVPSTGSVVTKATLSYWHYDATNSKTTLYSSWFNKSNSNNADTAKLYDSDKATQFQSIYDANGTNYLKLKKGATQGSTSIADYDFVDDGSFYLQIQYDLTDNYGNGVDLSKIIVCGEQSGWSMGKYDLFVSDNIETLYQDPVKSFTCAEANSYAASNTYNSLSFKEGTTAKYVALRVYKFHTWSDDYIAKNGGSWSLATPHFRMREFNVYGTRSTTKPENYNLTTSPYTSSTTAPSSVATNIATSLIRNKPVTKYVVSNKGVINSNESTTKYTTLTSTTEFKKHDVNNGVRYANTDSKGYKYLIDRADNYQEITYALDGKANIDSLVVCANYYGDSNVKGSFFVPYHYIYSLADNIDDLFVEGKSTTFEVYNTDDSAFLTVSPKETVAAKYVAIRFLCAVTPMFSYTAYQADNSSNIAWVRLFNLSVNGTYINPADAVVNVAKDTAVADVDAIEVSLVNENKTGITDTNGKYPVGTVVAKATEYYKDEVNSKEYTFNGWYNGDNLVSATAEYTYDLAGGDVTLTAKYDVQDLVTTYPVNFVDATQKVIKTIQVVEGEYLDPAVVNAIVVKEIYGYTVKRDNEGNVEWNDDVYANPVTAEITYTVQYKALDISSLVTLYKTDSDEYYVHEHYKYDTAIDIVYEGANSWVDEKGVVLIGEPTGRIYASGDRMKIYAKSDVQEAPEVAIVGKAHEQGKGFSVFAHVNVADAEAYGVIYASDNYYNNVNKDFKIGDVTPEGAAVIRVQKIEVSATNIGKVDFMTTLNYSASKTNPTRWARAYVVIDGQYYYSQVVGNKE